MKFIKAKDGTPLAVYKNIPAGQPVAAVLLIHGMGDHAQGLPYQLLTDHLLSKSFLVVACDLRGHGNSGGHRMYVRSVDDFVNDVQLVLDDARGEIQSLPLFVTGLSMGALIGLQLVMQCGEKIKGIVVVSPALDPSGSPALIRALVPLLGAIIPRKPVDLKLNINYISRDKKAVEEYTSDKLFQIKTTPKLGHALLKGIKYLQRTAPSFSHPVLMLQGSKDKIVPPKGGQQFFSNASSANKEIKILDGAFHNLFIETNRQEVFTSISDWLQKHTGL